MEQSFGEKLVGLSFNPSGDATVIKVKQLCAELANIANFEYTNMKEATELNRIEYEHTIGEILNAQMNVVKLVTLKYN